uniref:Pre-mRNA-splicing factor SLU7 n=1 Tax=Macrostomum lignano TaxID=282301 RepID=A0A1I8G199_9PLAT
MYDLERGMNAYKYKWSGTDPEPQFLRKEKSSEEEATTGLPTEDSSSSCDNRPARSQGDNCKSGPDQLLTGARNS